MKSAHAENFERIEFVSDGVTLRGRLYRPANVLGDVAGDVPVVVMAHGFSVLMTWLSDFATDLTRAGVATLVFDHRNFGESDGQPRFGFDNLLQIRGYRDAITFAQSQHGIDPKKIVVWGQSASSLIVQFVGALDDRVRAVICHTPVNGSAKTKFDKTSENFEWLRANWNTLDLTEFPAREIAVRFSELDEGEGQVVVAGSGATKYVKQMKERFNTTNWSNQVFILQRKLQAQFNEQRLPTKHLKVPTLFVVATDDEVPLCELATNRECFEMIDAPKRKLEISGGHFGLAYLDSVAYRQTLFANIQFLRGVFSEN